MKTTIKKLGVIICSILFLTSCSKKDEQVVVKGGDTPVSATSMLKFSGVFQNRDYKGSGNVNIYLDKGVYTLKFDNLVVEGGPDLKVYLAKDETKDNIVNLGALTTSATYNIPANTNVNDYKYVLIYCQQYSKLFVAAPLTAK